MPAIPTSVIEHEGRAYLLHCGHAACVRAEAWVPGRNARGQRVLALINRSGCSAKEWTVEEDKENANADSH